VLLLYENNHVGSECYSFLDDFNFQKTTVECFWEEEGSVFSKLPSKDSLKQEHGTLFVLRPAILTNSVCALFFVWEKKMTPVWGLTFCQFLSQGLKDRLDSQLMEEVVCSVLLLPGRWGNNAFATLFRCQSLILLMDFLCRNRWQWLSERLWIVWRSWLSCRSGCLGLPSLFGMLSFFCFLSFFLYFLGVDVKVMFWI
jgi:hypothetical protein